MEDATSRKNYSEMHIIDLYSIKLKRMTEKKEISLPLLSTFVISEVILLTFQSIIFILLIKIIPWCYCLVQPLPNSFDVYIIITDCLAFVIFFIAIIYSQIRGFSKKKSYVWLRLLNILFSIILISCFFGDIRGFELELKGYLLVFSLPFSFLIPLIALLIPRKEKKVIK